MDTREAIEPEPAVAEEPAKGVPGDYYDHLTPFDAEKLLKQHPGLAETRPELVYLQSQRDFYLTNCCGLYKEGMRAVFMRDIDMLNFLWPYAPKSEDTGKQWQSVVAFAYKHAIDKAVVALLDWLNEKRILFNVKTFQEDIMKTNNQDLHSWFCKAVGQERVKEMDSHFYLTSGVIEAPPVAVQPVLWLRNPKVEPTATIVDEIKKEKESE